MLCLRYDSATYVPSEDVYAVRYGITRTSGLNPTATRGRHPCGSLGLTQRYFFPFPGGASTTVRTGEDVVFRGQERTVRGNNCERAKGPSGADC